MSQLSVQLRLAALEDVESITALSEQLWYPVTSSTLRERLQKATTHPEHVVYVAAVPEGSVVGWVHGFTLVTLVMGQQAQIAGLIVHQNYRGQGIGQLLLRQAEQWATQQGCSSMIIRSNLLRKEAHQFYEKVGYRPFKTQLAFCKDLVALDVEPLDVNVQ